MTRKTKAISIVLIGVAVVVGVLGLASCTKEVPVEVIKEVIKEVPKEVIVTKEVIKEVPVVKEVIKEVPKEVPLNLTATAQKIQKGEIDVGKTYGMALDQRFHTIHATKLGLDCAVCHQTKGDATLEVFSAQDVSPLAPGAVNREVCLGCHTGGPAKNVYAP